MILVPQSILGYFVLTNEDGKLQPTRRGVKIAILELETIINAMPSIVENWPELAEIQEPCFMEDSKGSRN